MEKLILSTETANAIELLLNEYGWDKTLAVEEHISSVICDGHSWSLEKTMGEIDADLSVLDGISTDTIIKALYFGYEIDESHDYSVQQEIERCKRFIEDNRYPMDERAHYQKRLEGIEFSLKGLIK